MDKHFVVTIGREFGSSGKEIGELLGQKLGIKSYDQEIVELSALKSEKESSYLEDYDEAMETTAMHDHSLISSIRTRIVQDNLFELQSGLILDLARSESCVIIGRCADYVLREHPNAFHVFIYAPYPVKYNYVLSNYGLTPKATENWLYQVDKARHQYYKRYTKHNRGERANKHLLIDSSFLGVEGTAKLLESMVRIHFSK